MVVVVFDVEVVVCDWCECDFCELVFEVVGFVFEFVCGID